MQTARTTMPVPAFLAAALVLAVCPPACAMDLEEPGHGEAIRVVIEKDSRLGEIRNNASKNMPIARAVEDYVAGLDALDLERCPADFRLALSRHRDAWDESVGFFEPFGELRGELHDVFDAIRSRGGQARQGLEAAEAAILGTWSEVEKSMDAHAVSR